MAAVEMTATVAVPLGPRGSGVAFVRGGAVADNLVWVADADGALASQWASGASADCIDVPGNTGLPTTDPAWSTTTRMAQVTSPAPLTGTKCWQLTIRDGDSDIFSANAQRAEIGQNSPPRTMPDGVDRQMHAGQHRFIAIPLYIPSTFVAGNWCTFNQNKGNGAAGNGPLSIGYWRGRILLEKSTSQGTTDSGLVNVFDSMTRVGHDAWLKLLIEVFWSESGDGYYAFYGDLQDGLGFRQLVPLTYGWTLKYGPSGRPDSSATPATRVGIYREQISGTHSVYFGRVCNAFTRQAATVTAFGASL